MPIEIDGEILRTEAQWERVHRHVRKNAKGVERQWRSPRGNASAVFFRESQTYPWSKRQRAAQARERKRRRQSEHDELICAKGFAAGMKEGKRQLCKRLQQICGMPETVPYGSFWTESGSPCTAMALDSLRTSWQWLRLGFVPIIEARWHCRRSTGYWYCALHDVRFDPDRAELLLETGPTTTDELPDGTPYNGKPWW